MGLKGIVSSLEEVAEAHRGLYAPTEDGKGFALQAEGLVPEDKYRALAAEVKGFRERNITLQKEKAEFQAKYGAIDLEQIQREQAELEALRQGKGEPFEKVLAQRAESLRGDFDRKAQALLKQKEEAEAKASAAEGKYIREKIRQEVLTAAAEAKLRPDAVKLVLLAAERELSFDAEHDTVIARDPQGNTRYAKDMVTRMGAKEWLAELAETTPSIFPQSRGGGADPKGAGGGTVTKRRSQMSDEEKAKFIGEHGYEKYRQLPQ
jgi:hypothetical protein